jgi:hypothetical protein
MRTYNGSAAFDVAFLLETPSIWAWVCCTPAKLFPTAVQNTVWGDTDGPPGAGCTFKHHSLDPYGEHEMVQQHLDEAFLLETPPLLAWVFLLHTC